MHPRCPALSGSLHVPSPVKGFVNSPCLYNAVTNSPVYPLVQLSDLDALSNRATRLSDQEISREKAGIFKVGVPAFTVPQPPDALQALQVTRTCPKT